MLSCLFHQYISHSLINMSKEKKAKPGDQLLGDIILAIIPLVSAKSSPSNSKSIHHRTCLSKLAGPMVIFWPVVCYLTVRGKIGQQVKEKIDHAGLLSF